MRDEGLIQPIVVRVIDESVGALIRNPRVKGKKITPTPPWPCRESVVVLVKGI
jgi:hypothetical protein